MGYDLYGLNPTVNKNYPKEYYNLLKKHGNGIELNWNDAPSDVKDKYFRFQDKYQEDNPGSYFRNNVWWWRPLWNYVCEQCQDFLTVEDMAGGGSNDGHRISKTKALKISRRLSKLIGEGLVAEEDRKMTLMTAKAQASNQELKELMDEITKECHNEHGKLVPANYPEPYYSEWKTLQSQHDWDADYPFDADNIETFARFCESSGGFDIC
jgi:hypothetical protein